MIKKILIAIDDSPTSEKVASKGFQLGQQLNAEIALVSVVDITLLMTADGVTPREMAEVIKHDLIKGQQILMAKLFKDYTVYNYVVEGKPDEMILKVADEWEADLIIIGTHGRTGLSHLFMGSVAEKVIRHADIPVLVITSKHN